MAQPPKSARLQLLEGNPNKKNTEELERRAKAEEKLKMRSNKLKAPNWLDKTAKDAFRFLKSELLEIELVTNGDLHSLALYCYWYSQQVQLQAQVALLQEEDPELIGNPLLRQLDTCTRNIRMLGNDLGLSPAARVKLAIKMAEETEDESEWT